MSTAPEHFTVWMEIPVTDLDRATAFYNTVFKTELKREDSGPNPIASFQAASPSGVAGHLYPGKPAGEGSGPTIHLACPDTVEATLDRVTEAGGRVVSDVMTIPPGRFAYCLDLDGNSFGIFEAGR